MNLIGVDFTSAPRAAKPIAVAHGRLIDGTLHAERMESIPSWDAFEGLLLRPGPWLMALDMPFGLPADLVATLGWPRPWSALVTHCAALGKDSFRAALNAVRESRPAGARYLHRATDIPARSHSPMKLVNPPVGLMFLAGAPRLAAAGVHVPGMHAGDAARVAVEAYPGLLARRLGARSYKSDDRLKQTPERRNARVAMLEALRRKDNPTGIALRLDASLEAQAIEDGRGDVIDALLALAQAAWAGARQDLNYGLPERFDPIEGWIVGA